MEVAGKTLELKRFPKIKNQSLQAWNAADELVLELAKDHISIGKEIWTMHDFFGALACGIGFSTTKAIILLKSQEKAIAKNWKLNYDTPAPTLMAITDISGTKTSLVLMRVPKSLDMFRRYLCDIHKNCEADVAVYAGFMTRNFTAKWIEMATYFFETVDQSKASKKARVLILSTPKKLATYPEHSEAVENKLGFDLTQEKGIFSARKIDYATSFLIHKLPSITSGSQILDMCSGNGVVSVFLQQKYPDLALTLVDDNLLATQSGEKNISGPTITHLWNNCLEDLENQSLDYIFCNPPFHFEYENTVEIAVSLFKESAQKLKFTGELWIVANTHLMYKKYLGSFFEEIERIGIQEKYEILRAIKPKFHSLD